MYIPYGTACHEQTVDIIKFSQFEEGDLVKNERYVAKNESISALIDELYTEYDSDDESTSTNSLKEIRYGSYVHPDIMARYSRLKITDHIKC